MNASNLAIYLLLGSVIYVVFLEFMVYRRTKGLSNQNEKNIRKNITKRYLLGISRSNFLTIIVAISAALIAFNSGQISVHEAEEQRLHNMLSVKPKLNITYYANENTAGFVLNSSGLGPAVVKWVQVKLDDNPIIDWTEFMTHMNFPSSKTPDGAFSNPYDGTVFPQGGSYILFSVKNKNDIEYFNTNYGRADIKICYCSFYGELDSTQCWQTASHFKDIKQSCDETPTITFPKK